MAWKTLFVILQLEGFRQTTLKLKITLKINSRESTPSAAFPGSIFRLPLGRFAIRRSQWGRLCLSFPVSAGSPQGSERLLTATLPALDPILLAGRTASVTAALARAPFPRSRPPARASSRGLAWPRGPVPPGPNGAGARCRLGATPAGRVCCERRPFSAFQLPQPARPLVLTSLPASSGSHSRSIPSRRKHQLRRAASCPETKGSASPIARSAPGQHSATSQTPGCAPAASEAPLAHHT